MLGLKPNTVIRWLDNGMPVIELLTDLDRNQVEMNGVFLIINYEDTKIESFGEKINEII